MNDFAVQPVAEPTPQPGLSQIQRVLYTFTAPSKTFGDIKAGRRSWWLPFLIGILVTYIFFAAIYTKIGMNQVVENSIHLSAKSEQQMADAPPDRREFTKNIIRWSIEGGFLGSPVLSLIFVALFSLGLWATINFVFGGKSTYGSIFAVWMYASLPTVVKALLGIIVLYAGTAPESFNINNYAPTNAAAFLNPLETNPAIYKLLSSIDVITIWMVVLLGIGTAIVAGTKKSSGLIAVFGWWILFTLIGVGFTAATA